MALGSTDVETTLVELARAYQLSQPIYVAAAEEVFRAAGVADRCRIVPGDFLASVPTGADAYVVSNVLMDCDDAVAITLLGNCRVAMVPTGRLFVVERVIPADNVRSLAH